MSNKNNLKNNSKNSKPLKHIYKETGFEPSIFPDWMLISLLGCIQYGHVVLQNWEYPNGDYKSVELDEFTMDIDFFVESQNKTKSEEVKIQIAQKILDNYMLSYQRDQLSILDDHKTFEKSMKCTIEYLIQMEAKKGKHFNVYYKDDNFPPKDVNVFSDLVYLQQQGLIELPSLSDIAITKDRKVKALEIRLLVPAADIADYLIPEEPDEEYKGLKFYKHQKRLVYEAKFVDVKNTETKSMRLLKYMMKNRKPWPLKSVRKEIKVEPNMKDKTGRNAVDNILNTVRKYLDKLDFPSTLSLTAGAIVWRNK